MRSFITEVLLRCSFETQSFVPAEPRRSLEVCKMRMLGPHRRDTHFPHARSQRLVSWNFLKAQTTPVPVRMDKEPIEVLVNEGQKKAGVFCVPGDSMDGDSVRGQRA